MGMVRGAIRNPAIICLVIVTAYLSGVTVRASEEGAIPLISSATSSVGKDDIPKPFINLGRKDRDYAILVEKSAKRLNLYAAGESPKLIKVYPATTGRLPGDKKRRGDLRTPEGVYFFKAIYEDHQLPPRYGRRAFVMDYPNLLDHHEGKNGGGIWLHATNLSKRDLNGFDSRGCVVVNNENIMELSSYITLKDTPIIIVDKVEYTSVAEAKQYDREIMAMLGQWKSDWENKRLDQYMSHYSSDFFARGMKKNRWRKYKQWLNQIYATIDVEIANLKIFRHDGVVVASFRQSYRSDKHADVGLKKLFLSWENEQWKILTEEWTELTAAELRAQIRSLQQRAAR
jgi:murein L,D-transpeptidase YafK